MKRRKRSKPAENCPAGSPTKSIPGGGEHSAPPVTATSAWKIWLAGGLIALATAAAFSSSFTGAFVYDDDEAIVKNRTIRRLWPIWEALCPPNYGATVTGRPLLNLSLAVNYAVSGGNVWSYHAANLAIHIFAALLLFGIVRRTLLLPLMRGRWAGAALPLALVIALLWAVHPLQTESVTYIVQRAESLMGLLYLLTLYCFIRSQTACGFAIYWYAASVLACLLGMATKEVMVSAPLLVLLYDRTFCAGSFREAWRHRSTLYLALAGTWLLLGWLVLSADSLGNTANAAERGFTRWSYLCTQPGVIVHYLRLSLWPSALCLDRGWPVARTVPQILFPAILVIGLLALTAWALMKRPAWGFLGAWFFAILAPTSSIFPLRQAAVEHRMYLALAPVLTALLMAGSAAGRWLVNRGSLTLSASRVLGGSLVMMALVALGTTTFDRNWDYRSDVAIWVDAVAKTPGNADAHYNLATVLAYHKRSDEAIAEYEAALELVPAHADAHNNLGAALARGGRRDQAIAHFQKALKIKPDDPIVHNNFGLVLAECKRFGEAIAQYQKALDLKPGYAEAHNNLGMALDDSGRSDDAIAEYQKALELDPDYAEARNNLGQTLAARGQTSEAIAQYRKALDLKPDYVEARNNLGLALDDSHCADEAIDQYRQALKIAPEFVEARNNLGNALAGCGRLDEAILQYQNVLEARPAYAEAHNNLGLALARGGRLDEAIAQFRKALEIKPDFADARKNLALILSQKGRGE